MFNERRVNCHKVCGIIRWVTITIWGLIFVLSVLSVIDVAIIQSFPIKNCDKQFLNVGFKEFGWAKQCTFETFLLSGERVIVSEPGSLFMWWLIPSNEDCIGWVNNFLKELSGKLTFDCRTDGKVAIHKVWKEGIPSIISTAMCVITAAAYVIYKVVGYRRITNELDLN